LAITKDRLLEKKTNLKEKAKMKCCYCGYTDSKVTDSRLSDDLSKIKRRRECLKCTKRYTTYEIIDSVPLVVIKSNGVRQPFDAQKIKRGLIKAFEKRPIGIDEIDKMTAEIERQVQNTLDGEVSTHEIGKLVMEELKKKDDVAYIRFASVYLQFSDPESFAKFIASIKK